MVGRIIGRDDELAQARSALADGIDVLVEGGHGSGRSRFIEAVLADVDEATRARLRVVDELQDLTPDALAALARSLEAGGALVLASVLAHRDLSAAPPRLRQGGPAVRIGLRPLTARELGAIVEQESGAPVASDALADIVPTEGGRDVAALLAAARSSRGDGSWRRSEAGWQRDGEPRPIPGLRAALHAWAGIADDAATRGETLDLVALAGALRLSALDGLAAQVATSRSALELDLEQLEDAGAVIVTAEAGDWAVRIRDGIWALLAPRTIPTLRRRRLARAVVAALRSRPSSELGPIELVALARLALDTAEQLDGETLTLAARASLRAPGTAFSLRWGPPPWRPVVGSMPRWRWPRPSPRAARPSPRSRGSRPWPPRATTTPSAARPWWR